MNYQRKEVPVTLALCFPSNWGGLLSHTILQSYISALQAHSAVFQALPSSLAIPCNEETEVGTPPWKTLGVLRAFNKVEQRRVAVSLQLVFPFASLPLIIRSTDT